MNNNKKNLDDMDFALIRELEKNPRITNAELGPRVFSNRNTVARRIQQFQDQQIISISIVRHMEEFGLRIMAFFFLTVDTGTAEQVARRLSQYTSIDQVNVSEGSFDIMAFGWFQNNEHLLDFIKSGLGSICDIVTCQTLIALDATKSHYPLVKRNSNTGCRSYVVDELDLKIINALEKNPRQSYIDIERQLGTSRQTISKKINTLLDNQIISVVTYVNPVAQGYHISSAILLKIRPAHIDLVAEQLAEISQMQEIIICTGHYDIVALAVFKNKDELTRITNHITQNIPGVIGHDAVSIQAGIKSLFGLLI